MSAAQQEKVNDDNVQTGVGRQERSSEYRQRTRTSSQQQKGRQAKETKEKQKANIWLTSFLILASTLIALVAGLMIGYGVIGGKNPLEVLNFDTWNHLYKMVFG